MFFFYGAGSSASAVTALDFSPYNKSVANVGELSPLFLAIQRLGISESLTSIIYICISLLARQTFLLPGLFLYIYYSRNHFSYLNAYVLGVYCAGVGALLFIESHFQGQWGFQFYGDLVVSTLGAAGLMQAFATERKQSVHYCVIVLSCIAVLPQATEMFLGASRGISRLESKMVYPVYNSHPDYQPLISWLRENIDEDNVCVSGGDYFDDRTLPASVPGLQLFASRRIISVYNKRTSLDPKVANRVALLSQRLNESEILSIRKDVPPSECLYVVWFGDTAPPESDAIRRLYRQGKFSVWQIENPNDESESSSELD